MLEKLHNASETIWAKILMGILIFSFVGWGVANWIFGENMMDTNLATVGNTSVSTMEFDREINRQMAQMSKAMQKSIYTDNVAKKYFSEQVFNNMVSRILLEQRANDIKLNVSDRYIASIIKDSPEFMENGFFSTEKFDAILAANQISEREFADVLRNQVLREMLLRGLLGGTYVSNFILTEEYQSRNETRDIDWAIVKFDDFNISQKPTEDNLKETYAKLKPMLPEYRSVSYIFIPEKNIKNPDDYTKTYAVAQKVEDAIISGEDMKKTAEKFKVKFGKTAPFSIQKKGKDGKSINDNIIDDKILNLVFTMESGIENPLMELNDGFLIIRVDEIEPAMATPFESVRPQIEKEWAESEKEKLAYIRANEILKELHSGVDFKDASKKASGVYPDAKITRKSSSIFPAEVLNTAFNSSLGTRTIAAGNRAFYVVAVNQKSNPAVSSEKLNSIRQETSNLVAKMITDDYTNFLQTKYPLKLNEKMFKKLFSPR